MKRQIKAHKSARCCFSRVCARQQNSHRFCLAEKWSSSWPQRLKRRAQRRRRHLPSNKVRARAAHMSRRLFLSSRRFPVKIRAAVSTLTATLTSAATAATNATPPPPPAATSDEYGRRVAARVRNNNAPCPRRRRGCCFFCFFFACARRHQTGQRATFFCARARRSFSTSHCFGGGRQLQLQQRARRPTLLVERPRRERTLTTTRIVPHRFDSSSLSLPSGLADLKSARVRKAV